MLIFAFYVLIYLMRATCDFSDRFDENFWIFWEISLMDFLDISLICRVICGFYLIIDLDLCCCFYYRD